MTTHTTTRRPVTQRAAGHYINRDHTVTGTPAQLANILANHRTAGTLVAMTAPRPVGDLFQVMIRLREYQPINRPTARPHVRVSRARHSDWTRIGVITAAVVATATGLVAVAAYLIGQLVEFIAAHAALFLGVLALAAIFAGLTSCRRSTRRHCPGC